MPVKFRSPCSRKNAHFNRLQKIEQLSAIANGKIAVRVKKDLSRANPVGEKSPRPVLTLQGIRHDKR